MRERQAAGLCRRCGKPQAVGVNGLCQEHYLYEKELKRREREKKKLARICVQSGCGKSLPPSEKHQRCTACHARYAAYMREYRTANYAMIEAKRKAKQDERKAKEVANRASDGGLSAEAG